MKLSIAIIIFLCVTPVLADLYNQDSLTLELDVNGEFDLQAEHSKARLEKVEAQLFLYPQVRDSQKLVKFDSWGEVEDETVRFVWEDGTLGKKEYGYTSVVKTSLDRIPVRHRVAFPVDPQAVESFAQYLQPTTTIDSDNPAIRAKAAELASGEDDLFVVTFKLANWVENNVDYDLNTLTEGASQKASWVLENRQGVCDEMTSLFVAMARSLGIPARFVSGVSYTTSPLFSENWQPHGWAEVYFPDIGWVSFDIAFGEYGYVDATHIRLRDSDDPAEPATKFEWVSEGVVLNTEKSTMGFEINVVDQGIPFAEGFTIEPAIVSKEVDFGSYNVIKATLVNKHDYYAATTLQLNVPEEVEIIGRNKRTVLLFPSDRKEVSWVVKVGDDLNTQFRYTFPIIISSERNTTVESLFYAQEGKTMYTKNEVEELTLEHEEKTYSHKVSLYCDYMTKVRLKAQAMVECTIKNTGNTNLEDVNFCIDGVCDLVDLLINQQKPQKITLKTDKAGYNKVIVTAKNGYIEKSLALDYLVYDEPELVLRVNKPDPIDYGNDFTLGITLTQSSFIAPTEIEVRLEGVGFENKWTISELQKTQDLQMQLTDYPLAYNNKFNVEVEWHDLNGKLFRETQEISIDGNPTGIGSRIVMFWNQIVAIMF